MNSDQQVHRGLEDENDGNGHHDGSVHVPEERTEAELLEKQSERTHDDDGNEQRQPLIHAEFDGELIADVAAHHVYGAVGEIESSHDAEQQRKTQSHQDIHGGQYERSYDGVYSGFHLFLGSGQAAARGTF